MGAHGPLIYDAVIYPRLTQRSLGFLTTLSGPGRRNHTIRKLIIEDALRSMQDSNTLHDIRLLRYRRRIGKRIKQDNALFIRVSREIRAIALIRCVALNFSLSEYIVALVERAAHQEGLWS
jgi:hypothetical protein